MKEIDIGQGKFQKAFEMMSSEKESLETKK